MKKRPAHIKTDQEWIEYLLKQGEADSYVINCLVKKVKKLKGGEVK